MAEAPSARRKTKRQEPQPSRSSPQPASSLEKQHAGSLEKPVTPGPEGAKPVTVSPTQDIGGQAPEQLWQTLGLALNDTAYPVRTRFELMVRSSIEAHVANAERREASLEATRTANAQSFEQFAQALAQELEAFLRDALPARRDECHFLASFCFIVISGVFEQLAHKPPPSAELRRVADEAARMLAGHLGL